jgi:hypothetical protein
MPAAFTCLALRTHSSLPFMHWSCQGLILFVCYNAPMSDAASGARNTPYDTHPHNIQLNSGSTLPEQTHSQPIRPHRRMTQGHNTSIQQDQTQTHATIRCLPTRATGSRSACVARHSPHGAIPRAMLPPCPCSHPPDPPRTQGCRHWGCLLLLLLGVSGTWTLSA